MDGKAGDERHVLSCRPPLAVVHGGLWHGGRIHLRRDFCVGAWHGDGYADDVSADLPGLYLGLCGGGVCAAAALLPAGPDQHLCLSGPAVGGEVAPDGIVVLPLVKDGRRSGEVLRGVHHPAALCLPAFGHSLCRDGSGTGAADLALHPTGGHQDVGMDGLAPDSVSLYGTSPYYI